MERSIIIRHISPFDPQARELMARLDRYQISLYGEEHCNLDPPEVLAWSNALMLGAFTGDTLGGIGAIKLMDGYAEIKRMYIDPMLRRGGIARQLVSTLELFAVDNGCPVVCLETGRLHHAALQLYKKMGYTEVPSFGTYQPNPVSIYMKKTLPSR